MTVIRKKHFAAITTLFFFSTSVVYAIDAEKIVRNCAGMNKVAWEEYAESLDGQEITGTGELLSIDTISGFGKTIMKFVGVSRDYELSFRLGQKYINIDGYEIDQVRNLKIGSTYQYSARINKVDPLWYMNGCIIIDAEVK